MGASSLQPKQGHQTADMSFVPINCHIHYISIYRQGDDHCRSNFPCTVTKMMLRYREETLLTKNIQEKLNVTSG